MDRLLPLDQVLERVPVDRGTLDNWEKDNQFPRRIKVKGRIFWRESEIDKWIAAQESVT